MRVDNSNPDDPFYDREDIIHVKTGGQAATNIDDIDCLGATAWTFARDDVAGKFDYLFIDEAGQVSLANLIGMSRSAKNLVLIGDQMQLGQPMQGSHPGDSGESVLEYLLQDLATIPSDMGIFLPTTYRMHPDVCSYISESFYDGRLKSDVSAERRQLRISDTEKSLVRRSTGIQWIPVEHVGNEQGSPEEVEIIEAVVRELVGVTLETGEEQKPERPLGLEDILIVAPYNYQVNLLKTALGDSARIGSVDKFQGQEAPVVILSMSASSAADAPRGIDFLFSPNRLNVAISRAQCLAIVVGNPELANTAGSNLHQMKMINAFCRLVDEDQF